MIRRPALFLDRDGVVNVDRQFLHRIEDCRFIDGIFALTAGFASRGFAIIIASNQSGIARGLYSEADFTRFMDWMRAEFVRNGSRIEAVYYAPTHPTDGIGAYRRENPWRKPAPGMFLAAAADFYLDLAGSISIGNQMSDIEASRAAGIGTPGIARSQAARRRVAPGRLLGRAAARRCRDSAAALMFVLSKIYWYLSAPGKSPGFASGPRRRGALALRLAARTAIGLIAIATSSASYSSPYRLVTEWVSVPLENPFPATATSRSRRRHYRAGRRRR